MSEKTPYDLKIKSIVDLFKNEKLEFAVAVLDAAKERLTKKAILP